MLFHGTADQYAPTTYTSETVKKTVLKVLMKSLWKVTVGPKNSLLVKAELLNKVTDVMFVHLLQRLKLIV